MTGSDPERTSIDPMATWADALMAARLIAIDPEGLGGVIVRARPGPVREAWLEALRGLLPPAAPMRKLPAHVTDDRLLGGLDLAATLRAGRPVAERGLLAEADGGVVVAQMAERMSSATAARLAAVLDTREVAVERDGLTLRHPTTFALVAVDEGIADDERAAEALADRLAFRLTLDAIPPRIAKIPDEDSYRIETARALLSAVAVSEEILGALARAAEALGARSMRTLLLAVRAAAAAAALDGRRIVEEQDAALAGRLVIAPRATALPAPSEQEEVEPPSPPPNEPPTDTPENEQDAQGDPPNLDDIILAAASAMLPPGLLARTAALARRRGGDAAGKAGDVRQAERRGRPVGTVRGDPRTGKRLSLVATLRTAAPWQAIRRRTNTSARRIVVVPDDFRVRRLKHPTETTAIFVVDASGSSALHRLAEAKGAVELLLSECYVRRDQVAVLAFRGKGPELLLPPTRSLVRAKRSLAGLPGGGGTPLASAIDAAATLADAIRRKGQTPVVVLLTDGRANIARDGSAGRQKAHADALAAARQVRAAGFRALLVDTAPKPQETARAIAAEMDATYLPLPYAGAAGVSAAVRATLDVTAADAARP